MKKLVCLLVLFVAAAVSEVAEAEPRVPDAKCFADVTRWSYDRDKETLAAPGERFFADLKACDSTLAANIEEAIRYRIQAQEAETFARHKKYVFAAYGVAWALLAGGAVALWLRQRRLNGSIAELEAKIKAAEAGRK